MSDVADFPSDAAAHTFAPGKTSKTFTIKVFGDIKVDTNETFFLSLTNLTRATISDA